MKDAGQKEMLFKHFSAQGWYSQVEVPVYHRGGVEESGKRITDADVLALRPRQDLQWELIVGDCKTLKGQSPANRALWLRGLMDHVRASTALLILQRRRGQAIEPDHKLLASALGITLLDEDEFAKFDRAVVFPGGTGGYPDGTKDLSELYSVSDRFPMLKQFGTYLSKAAWNEPNRIDLLRTTIGQGMAVSRELDPGRRDHLALVLEAAGIFAIGLAACGGLVFNQHLQPERQEELEEALKIIIWGGRSRYQFIAKVREDLLAAKGIRGEYGDGTLALPIWEDFIQLVRNLLEHPRLSFRAPQLLRSAAIDVLRDRGFLERLSVPHLPLIKFAMLVVRYFCKASSFPVETGEKFTEWFAQRQSQIVHNAGSKTTTKPDGREKVEILREKKSPTANEKAGAQVPVQRNLPGMGGGSK